MLWAPLTAVLTAGSPVPLAEPAGGTDSPGKPLPEPPLAVRKQDLLQAARRPRVEEQREA